MPIPVAPDDIYHNGAWYNRNGSPYPTGDQPTQPAPGASPYLYANNTSAPIQAIVAGGTVSAIQVQRPGGGAVTTGLTSGTFRLAPNDVLIITYTVVPTLTLLPV